MTWIWCLLSLSHWYFDVTFQPTTSLVIAGFLYVNSWFQLRYLSHCGGHWQWLECFQFKRREKIKRTNWTHHPILTHHPSFLEYQLQLSSSFSWISSYLHFPVGGVETSWSNEYFWGCGWCLFPRQVSCEQFLALAAFDSCNNNQIYKALLIGRTRRPTIDVKGLYP